MSNREALKKKLETDLNLAQVRLTEFRAKIKKAAGGVHAENAGRIDALEQRIEEARARLHELNQTQDSVPEQLVDGVEASWSALQDSLQDAISTFEGKH